MIFSEVTKTKMKNITIEGAELAREVGKKIKKDFEKKRLPLMISMIDAISEDKNLVINWDDFI